MLYEVLLRFNLCYAAIHFHNILIEKDSKNLTCTLDDFARSIHLGARQAFMHRSYASVNCFTLFLI